MGNNGLQILGDRQLRTVTLGEGSQMRCFSSLEGFQATVWGGLPNRAERNLLESRKESRRFRERVVWSPGEERAPRELQKGS